MSVTIDAVQKALEKVNYLKDKAVGQRQKMMERNEVSIEAIKRQSTELTDEISILRSIS
jgi:hypothetical protein